MEQIERIRAKIFTADRILYQCKIWRSAGKKIVFTNGCFDLLHAGHIEYLSKASDLGDEMIIGLNSDSSVRKLKGPDRPVNNGQARALVLASLLFVSAVVVFDEETPYNLIAAIRPDFLVKGADYNPEEIAGHDIVTSGGGKVVTIPLTVGYSTTELISRIKG